MDTLRLPRLDAVTPRQRFVVTALGVLAGAVASVGTLAVTSAGFALSFDAIRAVGAAAHMRPTLTWLLPVCVDGAMAVSAVCAVVLKRMGRRNVYPWSVVVVGAVISIAANALHAYQEGGQVPLPVQWAMAASAVPALLLALSVHLVVILAEALRQVGQQEPDKTPTEWLTGASADQLLDAWLAIHHPSSGNAPRSTQTPQQTPADTAAPEKSDKAPSRGGRRAGKVSTADRAAKLLAKSPDLTSVQLALKVGVSDRQAQRYIKDRLKATGSPNGSKPQQQE